MGESGIPQDNSDVSARRRWRGFIVAGILLTFCAYLSIQLARLAWADTGMPVALRAVTIALSALTFIIAAYFVGTVVVRRIRTGRFFLTRAEALAKRAQIRERMGAARPFWPQARIWLVGWIFLAILASFGIGTLIAAFHLCHCERTETILLAALGLVFLALPGLYVFKAIRRRLKTGSFLPSPEEFDQATARCAQPKPLRQRVLLAGLYWLIALVWTSTALPSRHAHHHVVFGSAWVLPAMWWMVAAVWTWQVFHPRSPQCAIDPGMPPSIKPPAS
jgi:hypothetical protein